MQIKSTEISANIYDVHRRVLEVFVSSLNHCTQKFAATNNGQRRIIDTRAYHQWRYSFMKQKKYHVNRITVTVKVITAIATAPHLIGKQIQQVYPWVKVLEHTQSQQQHSSNTGSAIGSSSSTGSSFLSSYASAAPPSKRVSYSLRFLFFLIIVGIIFLIAVNYKNGFH